MESVVFRGVSLFSLISLNKILFFRLRNRGTQGVLLWYDLVVIEGGEGGFVDVFYAGLLEFDAVFAI